FPTGPASAIPAGLPAQTGQGGVANNRGVPGLTEPTKDDPFGIKNFNCADISTYHIDQQMNARADAIKAKCNGNNQKAQAPSGTGPTGNKAIDQLARPLNYGGPDVNVHPPTSP